MSETKTRGTRTLTPAIIGRHRRHGAQRRAEIHHRVAAAGFLDSFDIAIVAYALPKIRQEFNLTPQQVGLAGSAAGAGMGVGSWCGGWVADKWGRQVVLVAIVPIFAAFTRVAGLATSLGVRDGARRSRK